MRKKLFAAFYMIFLLLAFVSVPLFVVKKTLDMKSGWHGIPWESTESQVSDWVKKNNSNYDFEKCPLNHYGVLCRKLTWKKNRGDVPFDSIEFQFRNGKLCAVIESEKVSDFDPSLNLDLGRPEKGSDIKLVEVKEKGVRFVMIERVFYYTPEKQSGTTRERYAVSRLIKSPVKTESPEEIISWRLTKGSYDKEFYEEIKERWDNFPSAHFNF